MTEECCAGYDPFAWVYNKHWGDKFTPIALAVIDELVMPELPPEAKLLDLCCGTGHMAGIISQRGYRVTGIDSSKNMLHYARKNASKVQFLLADARSFSTTTTFDAVVCVFDSLNHVMLVDELGDVFSSVFQALNDGGLFLFDLNLEAGYKDRWNGIYGIVEDDHVLVVRNSYQMEEKIALFDATLFRYDDKWSSSDFTLKQRCYEESEVRSKLKMAGFSSIEVYEFTVQEGLKKLSSNSTRAFFLCRKFSISSQSD